MSGEIRRWIEHGPVLGRKKALCTQCGESGPSYFEIAHAGNCQELREQEFDLEKRKSVDRSIDESWERNR